MGLFATLNGLYGVVKDVVMLGSSKITSSPAKNIQIVPGTGGITQIGDANTTSHSLAANDDFYVSGKAEIDGTAYFDGTTLIYASLSYVNDAVMNLGSSAYSQITFDTGQTVNCTQWGLDNTSRTLLFCERADMAENFAHAAQTNPTVIIHSADKTDHTQYIQFAHNQTDAAISTGKGNIVVNAPVRGATSLWYHYRQISAIDVSPGASGATFTPPDANTIGGYQLDANTEYLYTGFDLHEDWDAASNVLVEVYWETNADNGGGGGTDHVDLQMVCRFKGYGETSCKTQTLEVPVVIGTAAQYTQFKTTFVIIFDDGSNPVETEDVFGLRLNLETDTSHVDNIIVNHFDVYYQSKQPAMEV